MPELPEAETVARQLHGFLCGTTIAGVESFVERLRMPVDVEHLRRLAVGRRVELVDRRAKYIQVHLSGGVIVLLHLGMTGTCRICAPHVERGKHEHVIFALEDGRSWRFVDPRKFGAVQAFAEADHAWPPASLAILGPEPLEAGFSPDYLFQVTRDKRQAIKVQLMDQRVVAGIGNIYASEILHRAGIRPGRASGRVTRRHCRFIVLKSRDVLREAIALGGTTISQHTNVDGSMGRFVQELRVYGRGGEPCVECGTAIKRMAHGGRSTYYCPTCQK